MSTRRFARRTILKRGALAVGAGLAVSLLAACTASNPPPAPTQLAAAPGKPAPIPPTAAPAVTKELIRVSIALASINPYNYVPIVGTEKPDLAARFGIQFDILTTTNSPNALNALIGGSVDVAIVTPDAAWPAQDKAPDIKQLLALANGSPYVLIGQPDIARATDLKGATLGVSALRGGADTTALRVLLAENGLTDADYTLVQAGTVSDRTTAMKARSIQAVAQLEPQATLLRDAGFKEIDSATNYASLRNIQPIVLVARPGWYQDKSETAVNLVHAWSAITTWLYDPANKDEILAITRKTMEVSEVPAQNTYKLHIAQNVVAHDLRIGEGFMQQFVTNSRKAGGENLPSDPMKYVDNSLLDKALGA
jgi:NitT/TauT family transport system substrate-binding protein